MSTFYVSSPSQPTISVHIVNLQCQSTVSVCVNLLCWPIMSIYFANSLRQSTMSVSPLRHFSPSVLCVYLRHQLTVSFFLAQYANQICQSDISDHCVNLPIDVTDTVLAIYYVSLLCQSEMSFYSAVYSVYPLCQFTMSIRWTNLKCHLFLMSILNKTPLLASR